MNIEKYVINFAQCVVPVDVNTIAILSFKENFSIKGVNMSAAVENILKNFNTPAVLEEVAQLLSSKYSTATLKKLLDFLVEKSVLIKECDSKESLAYDKAFLEKTFFYTKSGKSLQKIVDELTQLRIGIMGTSQLVRGLLDELSKSRLLTNFYVGALNEEIDLNLEANGVSISKYPLHADFSYGQKIVDDSDIIVVAYNYFDHYFFNQVNEMCFKANKKWLRVVVNGSNAEIGPLFIPGETCCYSCLQARLFKNTTGKERVFEDLYADKEFHERSKNGAIEFSSMYPLLSIASGMASSEIMKHLTGMECNLENEVLMVDCLDFSVEKAYIFKDYMCKICVHKDVVLI